MPALITVPMQSYIMIDGKGNPNDEDFSNRVAALYALAYAIKMGYKSAATKGDTTLGIHDFAVYPLEGIWKQVQSDELVKEELEYTIMIRQPDFITESMVCAALEIVKKKSPIHCMRISALTPCRTENVLKSCISGHLMMNLPLLKKMAQLAVKNGLKRDESYHREIYLNNANRVEKSKLKTILRFSVK